MGLHLLDREDPDTAYASDARHWIAIYRDLIALYRDLLDRAQEVLAGSRSGPPPGGIGDDIPILDEQLRRYERRLEFWYARQWMLEGLLFDRESRALTYRDRSIRLTGREFQLLETLAHRSPAYLRGRQLLVEAWRDSRLPEETLRTYIVRLRAKLAELEAGVEIVNRPRHGYALVFATNGAGPA